MKRGLVLGGGGVLGAAWMIGALQALSETYGWDPREADALVGRDKSTRRHVKATAAVKDQVKRGSRAVLGINAILRPTLKRNPDLKAAWKSAKVKKGPIGGGSTAAGVTLAPAAPAALVAPVAQQDASAATPKAA